MVMMTKIVFKNPPRLNEVITSLPGGNHLILDDITLLMTSEEYYKFFDILITLEEYSLTQDITL